MKKIIIIVFIFSFAQVIYAQQESLFSFYREHLNLVNPAFVGVDQSTQLMTSLREQWTGIEEAPSTQALSFMTPLGKKLSIGLSYVHDRVFIEKQSFIAIDFSYQVTLNEKLDLFMGIKAGGNNYEVNTTGLQTYNIIADPALAPISRFNPNFGVGFYLKHDKYYVSLSTPRLLNTERAKNEDGFATVATDRAHFYLSTGYNFELNNRWSLLPSTMVRYVNGSPFSIDFTLSASLADSFFLGTTYRTDQTLVFLTKIKLQQRMYLGYAYEYITQKELLGRANGSSEFFLQFKF